MTLLPLRTGRLAVDLAPLAGGSIARFTIDGSVEVLRPATADALSSGRGNETGCYPLVPFSNRIANGRLAFGGRDIVLKPNWPGMRHPMHGDGWAKAWDVVRCDPQSAEIVYQHDGQSGWPFRYRAHQSYRLGDDALSVTMAIENLEAHAVPAGLGLHPFFMRDADTLLTCRTKRVWLADAEVLPTELVDLPPQWDFSTASSVEAAVPLDNCFEGWDGRATITWPSRKLRLRLEASDLFRCLVIYVPPDKPFFCVEPVSHANGQVTSTRLAARARRGGEIVFRVSTM